jgi:hypothetical protein
MNETVDLKPISQEEADDDHDAPMFLHIRSLLDEGVRRVADGEDPKDVSRELTGRLPDDR